MNKKLLITAVAAALVGGAAVAQADVKLYGKFHLSMDRQDPDTDTLIEKSVMSSNSSRFGIKGSEDLGGGLKSLFQVESGAFNVDSGANGFKDTLRNTFVGLSSSGMGTIKFGRHDTPVKDLSRKVDLFNERVGDARNLLSYGSGSGDQRVSNMIRYESPSFGGISVNVLHAKSESVDQAVNIGEGRPLNSANVMWTAGPLFVGLGYEVHQGGAEDEQGIRLAASYNFGAFKVNGLYDSYKNIDFTDGADGNALGLGASFKMGNNELKAQYVMVDEIDGTDETGANMITVGVDHIFSKTVKAYLAYATVSNDDNADFTPSLSQSGNGHGETFATADGQSPSAISVGMEIVF